MNQIKDLKISKLKSGKLTAEKFEAQKYKAQKLKKWCFVNLDMIWQEQGLYS